MMKILFVDLTAGHDPKALYDKPTGGTLTSLTKVPEYLAKQGHEVFVTSSYTPTEKGELVNGVRYYAPGDVSAPLWDVVVFNRNVLPKDFVRFNKEKGIKIVWWLHDIVDTKYLPDDAFKMTDHIVALSNYCKRTFSDFYEIAEDKFTVIPNGVDPEVYYPSDYEKRDPHLFITASALIKGHLPLDITYGSLFRYDPELDFRIYSSQKLHGFDNSAAQQKFLENMAKAGAHIYAPMGQKSLAAVMRKAWALLMPNTYPEICSNLLIQARACGLPVVSSNIGANPEFLPEGTGLVTTKWMPHDLHSWIVEFASLTCLLQRDKNLHRVISEKAPDGIETWDQIGEKWNELLKNLTK
jgi:glycosyltransferase involved in cell wall biosynthesis